MFEMCLYGFGFFVATLCIQALLNNKTGNQGTAPIWVGTNAIIVICIIGIMTKNINYLVAVIGFVIADEIGKAAGWHK